MIIHLLELLEMFWDWAVFRQQRFLLDWVLLRVLLVFLLPESFSLILQKWNCSEHCLLEVTCWLFWWSPHSPSLCAIPLIYWAAIVSDHVCSKLSALHAMVIKLHPFTDAYGSSLRVKICPAWSTLTGLLCFCRYDDRCGKESLGRHG